MRHYLLDGETCATPDSSKTWGNLLDDTDQTLSARGRAVTVVRWNGVATPSFRDADAARRTLAELGNIEIESRDARSLLAETIASARESIGVLSRSATRLGAQFRLDADRGHLDLKELIEAIRTLTVLTSAIADVVALQAPPARAAASREALDSGEVARGVGAALGLLLECQARRDWPHLADCLEQRLAPAVGRWHELFDRLDAVRAGPPSASTEAA